MTTVRIAQPHEIPALAALGAPDRRAGTAAYLADLLHKGCTRPEWCFVAESGGQLVGSAVLWTMPGRDVPSDLVLLEAPWDEPDLAVGAALLDHAGRAAAGAGATEQGHVLDTPPQPPQHQDHPERRRELLERYGFGRTRDGRRFRWDAGARRPDGDPRLTWRSLADLGPAPFLALLTGLLADTRDAILAADVAEHGLDRAAALLWEESLEFEHDPRWYEIGYAGDGGPAVVSLPARNPAYPVIGFVGVSPRYRGQGYAASAVARGTQILAEEGATEIRGDCDAANVAMVKGFQRAGYAEFARRLEFRRPLPTP